MSIYSIKSQLQKMHNSFGSNMLLNILRNMMQQILIDQIYYWPGYVLLINSMMRQRVYTRLQFRC